MLDLEKYGIAANWPKLRVMQEEVAGLEHRRGAAEQEVAAARNAIPAAEQRDAEADAKAIRAGKSGPRAQHAAKARAALEDAERNLAAYNRALADAQSDFARFTADHRDELRAALVEALNHKGRRLAEHARQAAVLYGQLEDGKYDLKAFTPPPPLQESGPPGSLRGRSSTSVIAINTGQSVGPARGHIEDMLAYLASFAPPEEPSPAQPPPSGDGKRGVPKRGAA
jgi:hypothetical protein